MSAIFSRPLPRLFAVVGLQLLILLSIIGFKQYTVWTGETVLLKTQPVDPRDLLRGNYATVRYEISSIDTTEVAGDNYIYGDVYVELREDTDDYWEAVAVHNERHREFEDTVLIMGHVDYGRFNGRSQGNEDNTYEIDYGIEEVFIPEGSGDRIPPGTSDRPVAVELKVDRFGNAVPRRFFVDGEPLDLERR